MLKNLMLPLVLKGVVIAAALSCFQTLLLGLLYYFTPLSENAAYPFICLSISIFAASLFIAYSQGSKGFFYGLGIGLLFFFLLFVVSLIFSAAAFSFWLSLSKLAVSLLSGCLGGVLGALFSRK